MRIPDGLTWLAGTAGGAGWLAALPHTVAELTRRWGLEVGEPFEGSNVSWVAPARHDGAPVVLKVQWPHRECDQEAAALVVWGGDGAVELLAHDPELRGLLLERCRPGTHLAAEPDADPMGVMIDLLPRLWKPAGDPFRTLAAEADGWAKSMLTAWDAANRPCERRLVDAARSLITELGPSQGQPVLLHQDLHGDNVLAAQRSSWLAIDPKPLVGERELSCAPIVRAFEFGHFPDAVTARLDRLCVELGLDRDRARGWTIAQTMAWSFSSTHADRHFETVRWLLDR